ncbi:MAG: ABC transporter ATP-binding protein [Clostridia bacterium]|nr:ABC transporter ATP-binding protein [Clostridia bacterium]
MAAGKKQAKQAPVVIDVKDVTKKFVIFYDKGTTLKERILFKSRRRHEDHQVLKGISFQVRKGEAVGLIGENGCGKSTTLKMLTRILYPDSGTITMTGRVSSLIELGAGFHPDMSGRENIYTNASIFGLKRKEIDRRLEEIISFSELGEFIDNPVRTYSSGMYMRLAFAVAINVDADILLIDEILAVGDAAFQAKCFAKLQEIKAKGTTIVIVSHALSSIEQFCERSIWISGGVIRMDGAPRDVHPEYMEYMTRKNLPKEKEPEPEPAGAETEAATGAAPEPAAEAAAEPEPAAEAEAAPAEEKPRRWGSGEARINQVTVLGKDGKPHAHFAPDEPFTIRMEYTAEQVLENAVVGIAIYRSDQTYIYGTNTLIDTSMPVTLQRSGTIDLKLDCLPAANGEYTIDLALHRPDGFNYDFLKEVCSVWIADKVQTPGVVFVPHRWEMK